MINFADNPWIISDTHFNHINIKQYCNRPDDWQIQILTNWFNMVKNTDTIFHLGDFAMGKRDNIEYLLPWLSGNIYLLKGNHDRQKKQFYLDLGINLIEEDAIIWDKYIFSHRPKPVYGNVINLHGHIHNNPAEKNHINCCVEMTGYKPVRLFDLIGVK